MKPCAVCRRESKLSRWVVQRGEDFCYTVMLCAVCGDTLNRWAGLGTPARPRSLRGRRSALIPSSGGVRRVVAPDD